MAPKVGPGRESPMRSDLLLLMVIVLTAACNREGPRPEETPMKSEAPEPPAASAEPEIQVTVEGTARNAKGGAVIVGEDGVPIYLPMLPAWPDGIEGTVVEVDGRLDERKLLPDPAVGEDGAHSAGAEGTQTMLLGAPKWRRSLGSWTVISGTARNAGGGPLIHTPEGPVYLPEVGERWPEAQEGKSVDAVGKLMRNKRPSTPKNDDSRFGGRPELTEAWVLKDASWRVGRID